MRRRPHETFVLGAALACLLPALAACSRRPEPPEVRARRALEEGRDQDAYRIAGDAVSGAGAESAEAWMLRARSALRTWRTVPGVEAAHRARELAPEDARTHHVVALLERRHLRVSDAIAAEREAIRLDPDEARYRLGLGELLLGIKNIASPDYPAAEAAFRDALRLDPASVRARFGLAKTLVLGGKHEEGRAELDAVLAARPFEGEAYYLRGVTHLRKREYPEAVGDLLQATALDPQSDETLFTLARAFTLMGNRADAETARSRHELATSINGFLANQGARYHSSPDDPGTAIELAKVLVNARRFEDALVLSGTLRIDRPRLPAPHLLFGSAALEIGDVEGAAEAAAAALELAPSTPDAQLLTARVMEAQGNAAGAVPFAREAVRLAPESLDCRMTLGDVLVASGAFDEAARIYDAVRRADPSQAMATAGLARALAGAGNAARADAAWTDALRQRPRRAEWHVERARVRRSRERDRSAEDDLRRAISLAPGEAAAYGELADLLRESDRGREAAEMSAAYERITRREKEIDRARATLRRKPRDEATARRLAELLREAGRESEALLLEGRVFAFGADF